MLIFVFVLLLVGSLIGSLCLRAAADWVAKKDVSFGHAFGTVFFSAVISWFTRFIPGPIVIYMIPSIIASDVKPYHPGIPQQIGRYSICFFMASGVVSNRLELPYSKSMLVTLVLVALAGVIVGSLAFILPLVFKR